MRKPKGMVRMRLLKVGLMVGLTLSCALFTDRTVHAEAFRIMITDHSMSPAIVSARVNHAVHIEIRNQGRRVHNFILPAFYIFTPNLQPNESTSVEFTPDKTGTFPYYSDTGGTKELGLTGEILIKAP